MDMQSILPLLLQMNGEGGSVDVMSMLSPSLEKITKSNPQLAPLLKMASQKPKRAVGLAPIKKIATNEILGMLSRFFS